MMEKGFWAWNKNFGFTLCFQTKFFFIIFLFWENVWTFVYNIIFCVIEGISTLMSISDGLGSYFFRRKIERTQPMREELDGEVIISRQSRHILSL